MLARNSRILRQEGFSNTIRLGSRSGSRALVVYLKINNYASNGKEDQPLGGIVVGKREFKLAVDRNRMKRRLRHALVPILQQLPPGARVVVRGLPAAKDMSSTELNNALEYLVQKSLKKHLDKRDQVAEKSNDE